MPNADTEAWSIPIVPAERSCRNGRMGIWPGRGGSVGTGPGPRWEGSREAWGSQGLAMAAPCGSRTSAWGCFATAAEPGVERGSLLFVCRRVVVSLLLFWKSTAPSRDSAASKLSPELFGGAFFFLPALMQAVPSWGQSVAARGAEVQDRQSCLPSACNTGSESPRAQCLWRGFRRFPGTRGSFVPAVRATLCFHPLFILWLSAYTRSLWLG